MEPHLRTVGPKYQRVQIIGGYSEILKKNKEASKEIEWSDKNQKYPKVAIFIHFTNNFRSRSFGFRKNKQRGLK